VKSLTTPDSGVSSSMLRVQVLTLAMPCTLAGLNSAPKSKPKIQNNVMKAHMPIGKPVHFKTHNAGWSACGVQSKLSSNVKSKVSCLRCRKTETFRSDPIPAVNQQANAQLISLAPDMRQCVELLHKVVEDLLPQLGNCMLQDYAALNEGLLLASRIRNLIPYEK